MNTPTSIVYGETFLDKGFNYPTHHAQSMTVDNFEHTVTIAIRKGLEVNAVKLTMEECERIGFIDFSKLKHYCK